MCDLVLEINHPPFGRENTFAAFYIGKVYNLRGMSVTIILRKDGIFAGIKGQDNPLENINLPSTELMLEEMMEMEVSVVAEKDSMNARGLSQEDLMEGIEPVDSDEINRLLVETDAHVLSF
jgi:sulfur relay (sulfurtransferase) DsrF/TusC family protein